MDVLLDTHTFLWFIGDDPRLSPAAAELIEDPGSRVRVSVVERVGDRDQGGNG